MKWLAQELQRITSQASDALSVCFSLAFKPHSEAPESGGPSEAVPAQMDDRAAHEGKRPHLTAFPPASASLGPSSSSPSPATTHTLPPPPTASPPRTIFRFLNEVDLLTFVGGYLHYSLQEVTRLCIVSTGFRDAIHSNEVLWERSAHAALPFTQPCSEQSPFGGGNGCVEAIVRAMGGWRRLVLGHRRTVARPADLVVHDTQWCPEPGWGSTHCT